MFPHRTSGDFHLYLDISYKVIYVITTKFLHLKNKAISLMFKIWLEIQRKKTYARNEITYSFIYIFPIYFGTHQYKLSQSWWSFTPHFLDLNLVFHSHKKHLPRCASADSLWNLSLLITTRNSLTIAFSWVVLVSSLD